MSPLEDMHIIRSANASTVRPSPPSAERMMCMSSSGYMRMNSARDELPLLPLSSDTSTPYFLSAALMRPLMAARCSPEYWAAFFGMLMYDQAARQWLSLSRGYRFCLSAWYPGSAYVTSP